MSFASEVKQEVAQKVMSGSDARAELSALVQMCSSLSLSSRGMTLLITVENAAVARRVFSLLKERYDAQIEMFVKRKMNLKKNRSSLRIFPKLLLHPSVNLRQLMLLLLLQLP